MIKYFMKKVLIKNFKKGRTGDISTGISSKHHNVCENSDDFCTSILYRYYALQKLLQTCRVRLGLQG